MVRMEGYAEDDLDGGYFDTPAVEGDETLITHFD